MTWKQLLLYLDAVSNRMAPAAIVLTAIQLCCGSCSQVWQGVASPHPSDEAMIRNYHEHKAEFEQLIQMLQAEDEFEAVFPRDARSDGGCRLVRQAGSVGVEDAKCAAYPH